MATSVPDPLGDVNPYAAPAMPDAIEPFELAGIGIWRHGTLLVVHEAAELLPVCIKSAEPGVVWQTVQLRWSHWAQWPYEYLSLKVAFTDRWQYWLTTGRRFVLIGVIALALIILAMALSSVLIATELLLMPCVILLVLELSLFVWWLSLQQPLRVVRRKRRYYWLSGAHLDYLSQFPEWPYGK
jgi:hypothetical protein